MGTPVDLTTLGASAGVGGAITLLLVQIIKILTGWSDRKALATALVVALAVAGAGFAALHSATVNEAWQVVVSWFGNAAAAVGGYHLLSSSSDSTSSTPSTPDPPDAMQAGPPVSPSSDIDPTPVDTTPIPQTVANPRGAAKHTKAGSSGDGAPPQGGS